MSQQPLLTGDHNTAGASFDPSRVYRYTLWRRWDLDLGECVWIMLNPSTADETVLDPTIRRCIAFARAWGHGGITVVNLYALRSTDPRAIRKHESPIGPDNNKVILMAALGASRVVAAWGRHGLQRGADVAALLRSFDCPLECLGVNSDGTPKHPLYVAGNTAPVLWEGKA